MTRTMRNNQAYLVEVLGSQRLPTIERSLVMQPLPHLRSTTRIAKNTQSHNVLKPPNITKVTDMWMHNGWMHNGCLALQFKLATGGVEHIQTVHHVDECIADDASC